MKMTVISIIVSGLLVGAVILSVNYGGESSKSNQADNVSFTDGKQIIEIMAKGGYSPKISAAKANIATILRVQTKGTFDCSSALAIPSIGYRANLPPAGITKIEVPAQKSGTTLRGICAMGMYNFQIKFQ